MAHFFLSSTVAVWIPFHTQYSNHINFAASISSSNRALIYFPHTHIVYLLACFHPIVNYSDSKRTLSAENHACIPGYLAECACLLGDNRKVCLVSPCKLPEYLVSGLLLPKRTDIPQSTPESTECCWLIGWRSRLMIWIWLYRLA